MATVNEMLFNQISSYLTEMGLGSLFSYSGGKPAGWLWDQISSGLDNQAALLVALEDTPVFTARYGIIKELRQQQAAGKAVHVPSVAEVREYENTVASMMRQAGLPDYMYDSFEDTHNLLRNGLSAAEVEQRLGQAWERVRNTDPAVRDAYSSFYGADGDAALAATFLDPAKTLSQIERQSRAAYTAGYGQRMGISIDQLAAERMADLPKTEAGIFQDLTRVNELAGSGIFAETMGEAADADLEANTTGLDAIVFGDGAANQALQRRTEERKSVDRSASGGALRTQRGATGLGVS